MESFLFLQLFLKMAQLCILLQRGFATTPSIDGGVSLPSPWIQGGSDLPWSIKYGRRVLYKLQAQVLRGLEICIFILFKALRCKKKKKDQGYSARETSWAKLRSSANSQHLSKPQYVREDILDILAPTKPAKYSHLTDPRGSRRIAQLSSPTTELWEILNPYLF